MWVLLIKKLLSTAIEKLLNLPCTDQIDRCRRVIRGFFVCRDRYEKNGKLIGWKTRFWNHQFSDKVCHNVLTTPNEIDNTQWNICSLSISKPCKLFILFYLFLLLNLKFTFHNPFYCNYLWIYQTSSTPYLEKKLMFFFHFLQVRLLNVLKFIVRTLFFCFSLQVNIILQDSECSMFFLINLTKYTLKNKKLRQVITK